MTDLRLDTADLQAIIEDHDRNPRHFGVLSEPDHRATGYNPVCGDRYEVSVRLRDQVIEEIKFDGYGCAISKASASMMTESMEGMTVAGAIETIDEISRVLTDGGSLSEHLSIELESLLGVRNHPSRIKCVTLAWQAARAALCGKQSATTE